MLWLSMKQKLHRLITMSHVLEFTELKTWWHPKNLEIAIHVTIAQLSNSITKCEKPESSQIAEIILFVQDRSVYARYFVPRREGATNHCRDQALQKIPVGYSFHDTRSYLLLLTDGMYRSCQKIVIICARNSIPLCEIDKDMWSKREALYKQRLSIMKTTPQ